MSDAAVQLRQYEHMVLSRQLEQRLCDAFSAGAIPGWIHSALGQEVTGAVLGCLLRPDDWLVPHFRGRAALIAKGMTLRGMVAEIFLKASGVNRGRGGEVHLADPDHRIVSAGGVLGSGAPIAVGLGYAAQLAGKCDVVAVHFGDGSTGEGAIHESLNLAALWSLPVVFVCENNGFGEFSPTSSLVAVPRVSKLAAGYGIPGVTADTRDVPAVEAALCAAIARARRGEGPSLVETLSYRWRGHFEGDPARYRAEHEAEAQRRNDPLRIHEERLIAAGVLSAQQAADIRQDAGSRIADAVAFAQSSPSPDRSALLSGVYA